MNRKDTLKWFAGKMLSHLDENTWKVHWRFVPQEDLIEKLDEQSSKLYKELKLDKPRTEVIHTAVIRRCAHIANYAMMIADNERRFLEK
jgi:hypothetical protein